MNIEWANANYTGGGFYGYIGKLKNGNYFMAADDWNTSDECFVYEVNSKVVFDSFTEDDPAPWSNEWMNEHLVKTYGKEAFTRMLEWIITNKPEGNYSNEELKEKLK